MENMGKGKKNKGKERGIMGKGRENKYGKPDETPLPVRYLTLRWILPVQLVLRLFLLFLLLGQLA